MHDHFDTFEEALGACMAHLARAASSSQTMRHLAAGGRGFVTMWATRFLRNGTPVRCYLKIQLGEHQVGDVVQSEAFNTDHFPRSASGATRSLPGQPRKALGS